MSEEVKLVRNWSSPYALRIVWALKLKGIEYETIWEDLTNKSPLLLQYNPIHKKIPVLVHNGKPILESLVILEYIEETCKQAPILPEDPYQRATVRFWAKFGDDKLLPSVRDVFLAQGKEQEELLGPAMENLKLIEQQLKGKKFFGGETIGFLDLAMGWLAYLLSVLGEVADIQLMDAEKFPLLAEWIHNFTDHPATKESWPSHDKLITKFVAMREMGIAKATTK